MMLGGGPIGHTREPPSGTGAPSGGGGAGRAADHQVGGEHHLLRGGLGARQGAVAGEQLHRGPPRLLLGADDDIIAVAESAVAAGLRTLPVPDNYYDDLAARSDLPPHRRELMRRLNILHDRDPGGRGEFLHFFTPLLDGHLFFEVVQRVGGYEGYGARNTPVRMAVHRTERAA